MAGKKRNQIVDVPQSKTAKRSQGKKAAEGFLASGDMDRIIPLNGGQWAYILDPRNGLTHHVRVGSGQWNTTMIELLADARHGGRIQTQLDKLGWPTPSLTD